MLRAREPRLLNRERAERMLDAASFEDAAKILTDCGYPDLSQMKADEVEQALAERRSAIFDELGKLSPDKELVDLFKLKYDYHNAKAILKAEAMGSDCRRLLSDSGRIPGGKLLELYNEDRLARLPEILAGAMAEAKAVLGECSEDVWNKTIKPLRERSGVKSIYPLSCLCTNLNHRKGGFD